MRREKVAQGLLFVTFFVCLHFLLRFLVIGAAVSTTCNAGGPFGILLPGWLFFFIVLGVMVFLIVQWRKEEVFFREWPWLLVFAGGLGNFAERFFFGCITDYIAFPFFPVFNVADVLLTIGVLGIVIQCHRGVGDEKFAIKK